MKPAVSIVIPVYNVEDFISSTLESVKRQTYKNIEVIIVNDGSTDKTLQVIEQTLADADFPWVVINQENQGVSTARNVGLIRARGEYVFFLDGDDRISDQFIEKMYKKAKECDCDIVFCKWDRAKENGTSISLLGDYDFLYSSKVHQRFQVPTTGLEVLKEHLKFRIWISTCSAIYKNDFLTRNNLIYTPGKWVAEDQEFIITALVCASRVASVSDTLVLYVQRKTSSSRNRARDWEKLILEWKTFEELLRTLEVKLVPSEVIELFENHVRVKLWTRIKQVYTSKSNYDPEVFDELLSYAKHFKPFGGMRGKSLFIDKLLLKILPPKITLKLLSASARLQDKFR